MVLQFFWGKFLPMVRLYSLLSSLYLFVLFFHTTNQNIARRHPMLSSSPNFFRFFVTVPSHVFLRLHILILFLILCRSLPKKSFLFNFLHYYYFQYSLLYKFILNYNKATFVINSNNNNLRL